MPLVEPIVAIAVLLLVHVPPVGVQLSGDEPPTQTVVTPPITDTRFTFIVLVAVDTFPHASVAVTVYVVVVTGLTVVVAPVAPPGDHT